MKLKKIINNQRERREFRVRNKVRGDAGRPRLCVNRTLKHFYCQLIDDESGRTLASASSKDADAGVSYGSNCEAATKVGKLIAQRATAAGIKAVRLDRGSCRYHGRVAAFAEAAREAGLEF
ncbi:50S ribosomal protein L18 [Aureliella helgolandensis]|uniref:50S ribosomal protein L18 n=1 Tax=Aureliella helgolandensis TaxID=2527968 RepID=UPI0011A691BB|nr:50S ribosomal protein L18 [Aureliella helgolandensis]